MIPTKLKKRVYKALPPHTNQPHPIAQSGEMSKPFLIVLITILLMIVLVAFLLYKGGVVGRAFFTGETNTAGFAEPASPITENTAFPLVVRANIGTSQTVGVEFELPLQGSGLQCSSVESLLEWSSNVIVDSAVCDATSVRFRYSILDTSLAKTGSFDVARINFAGALAGTHSLSFNSFNIFNVGSAAAEDLVTNGIAHDLVIVAAQTPASTCTSGTEARCTATGREICDTSGSGWVASNCPNGQTCTGAGVCQRICTDSDTANDTRVVGTVAVGTVVRVSDSCSGDRNIFEVYCSASSPTGYTQTLLTCANGETCAAGACQVAPPACGNGVREGIEACDGADLGSPTQTCITQGFTSGTLRCSPTCAFDTLGCSVSSAPQCVDADSDGVTDTDDRCTSTVAGSIVDANGCSTQQIDPDEDSVCDPGAPAPRVCPTTSSCSSTLPCMNRCTGTDMCPGTPPLDFVDDKGCTIPPTLCGNGLVDAGEQCDGGNAVGGDGCSSTCQREDSAFLCTGTVPENARLCLSDETDLTVSASRSVVATCTDARKCEYVCSTGYVEDNSNVCVLANVCGNDVREGSEQCDDGNTANGDGCSSTCQNVQIASFVCGNRQLETGEQCEDGNTVPGDGCSITCQIEQCSDIEVECLTQPPLPATPSTCGDGRIGYIDTNANNAQDVNEYVEACDIGSAVNPGCVEQCRFIELGYKGVNCNSGSTTCQVTQMTPREYFTAKVDALTNGECYPNVNHPRKLYCDGTTPFLPATENLNARQRIYFITQLSTATADLLRAIFVS